MKGFVAFLVLLFIAGGVLVGIAFGMGLKINDLEEMVTVDRDKYTHEVRELELEDITYDLKISTITNNITIVYSNEAEKITFDFYKAENETIVSGVENGVISFEITKDWYYWLFFWDVFIPDDLRAMTVTIPEGVNFSDISFDMKSGGLSTDYLKSDNNVNLYLASGNVKLSNIVTDTLKIDISSGTFNLLKLEAKRLDLHVSSGEIRLDTVALDTATVSISSGSFNIGSGYITTLEKLHVSSGEVKLSDFMANKMNVHISSGRITLDFSSDISSYQIKTHTSAGSVMINGSYKDRNYSNDVTNNDYYLDASVSSGNIIITY